MTASIRFLRPLYGGVSTTDAGARGRMRTCRALPRAAREIEAISLIIRPHVLSVLVANKDGNYKPVS